MSSRFQYVNLAGVVALVILCIVQWTRDRALNLEVNRLEKSRINHEQTISDQEKSLRGLNSDLAAFKDQLTSTRSELAETSKKLRESESSNNRLTLERDQLRENITNWMNAVALRDERLKEANTTVQNLADQLNASILKFNELATNYNSVVAELDTLRNQPAGATAK